MERNNALGPKVLHRDPAEDQSREERDHSDDWNNYDDPRSHVERLNG